ncbi:unnamed protein product [Pedinophyceae sp. YPF-701]|nr:unnamed protein product [Pedinophyceae sp. YPF-701]
MNPDIASSAGHAQAPPPGDRPPAGVEAAPEAPAQAPTAPPVPSPGPSAPGGSAEQPPCAPQATPPPDQASGAPQAPAPAPQPALDAPPLALGEPAPSPAAPVLAAAAAALPQPVPAGAAAAPPAAQPASPPPPVLAPLPGGTPPGDLKIAPELIPTSIAPSDLPKGMVLHPAIASLAQAAPPATPGSTSGAAGATTGGPTTAGATTGGEDDADMEDDDNDGDKTAAGKTSASGAAANAEEEGGCAVCDGGHDPEKLLMCELCPRYYHTYCLDPPLKGIPEGNWYCPQCYKDGTVVAARAVENMGLSLLDTEKVVAERTRDGVREFHVKFQHRSFLHTLWIPATLYDHFITTLIQDNGAEKSMALGLKKRVTCWNRKQRVREQRRAAMVERGYEEVPSSDDEEGEGGAVAVEEDGVDPSWRMVHRVLARDRDRSSKQMVCLVKWQNLDHESCTWEFESEMNKLEEGPMLIARYEATCRPITAAGPGPHAKGKILKVRKGQAQQDIFPRTPEYLAGGNLHDYQLVGLNWLFSAWIMRKHVILADEMGLGKTIQTIAYLRAVMEEGTGRPHMVVVPLSTLPNWEREFERWAPDMNVVSLRGNQASRKVIQDYELFCTPTQASAAGVKTRPGKKGQVDRIKFHVLLTTYEMAMKERRMLEPFAWECLVVDEGHRLKSSESKLFKALHDFRTEQRTLLTGTPLQNNLEELWILMHFLDAEKFSNKQGAGWGDSLEDLSQEDQVKHLHRTLAPNMLRRVKKDVLQELPPKKEQIVRVELSATQKRFYRQILQKNFPSLGLVTGNPQDRAPALKNVLIELRKCCNHPWLFEEPPMGVDPKAELNAMLAMSGKLQLLQQMCEKLKDRGHRVLIYSQFTTLLDLLERWCDYNGWGFQRIDGSVPSVQRQACIDRFNSDPKRFFVFLLSTRAGGLGINLATADTVIIYDSDWNPHNDLQAQARAHRMGQKREVMIYRLVSRKTVEERMMQRAKSKMVLEHLVVRRMGKDAMKQKELDDILRYGAQDLFEEDDGDAGGAGDDGGDEGAHEGPTKPGETYEEGKIRRELQRLKDGRIYQYSYNEGMLAKERRRQQEEERKAIVWTDDAIERLLNRQQAWEDAEEEEAGADAGGGGEYLDNFKVADFSLQEKAGNDALVVDEAGRPADAAAAAAGAADGAAAKETPPANFWASLLGKSLEELQAAVSAREAAAELAMEGPRNTRTKVDFKAIFEQQERVDEEDDPSDEELDEEELAAREAARKRAKKGRGVGVGTGDTSDEEFKAVIYKPREPKPAQIGPDGQPIKRKRGRPKRERDAASERSAGAAGPDSSGPWAHAITRHDGKGYEILGFSKLQREQFLKALTTFGVNYDPDVGRNVWTSFRTRSSLVHKTDAELDEYLALVTEHLDAHAEAERTAKEAGEKVPKDLVFVGDIPKEVTLGKKSGTEIKKAVAEFVKIREAVRKFDGKPAEEISFGPLQPKRLPQTTHWTLVHDIDLLKAVLLHGGSNWKTLLSEESRLQETVRRESSLPNPENATEETIRASSAWEAFVVKWRKEKADKAAAEAAEAAAAAAAAGGETQPNGEGAGAAKPAAAAAATPPKPAGDAPAAGDAAPATEGENGAPSGPTVAPLTEEEEREIMKQALEGIGTHVRNRETYFVTTRFKHLKECLMFEERAEGGDGGSGSGVGAAGAAPAPRAAGGGAAGAAPVPMGGGAGAPAAVAAPAVRPAVVAVADPVGTLTRLVAEHQRISHALGNKLKEFEVLTKALNDAEAAPSQRTQNTKESSRVHDAMLSLSAQLQEVHKQAMAVIQASPDVVAQVEGAEKLLPVPGVQGADMGGGGGQKRPREEEAAGEGPTKRQEV